MKYDAIGWWSGGITSAIACKIAVDNLKSVKLVFIETHSHHADTPIFKKSCENWYQQEIEIWDNKKYEDHFDVLLTERFINGPGGAKCTAELKKKVRETVERFYMWNNQIFGFEYSAHELNRAKRFKKDHSYSKPIFPLIKKHITKNNAAAMLQEAGIELPAMYKMGYNHNNCIGCVKGGMGYWNKIKIDFPAHFAKMVEVEKEIGRSCINGKFLKDLLPHEGRNESVIIPECGAFCEKTT